MHFITSLQILLWMSRNLLFFFMSQSLRSQLSHTTLIAQTVIVVELELLTGLRCQPRQQIMIYLLPIPNNRRLIIKRIGHNGLAPRRHRLIHRGTVILAGRPRTVLCLIFVVDTVFLAFEVPVIMICRGQKDLVLGGEHAAAAITCHQRRLCTHEKYF